MPHEQIKDIKASRFVNFVRNILMTTLVHVDTNGIRDKILTRVRDEYVIKT